MRTDSERVEAAETDPDRRTAPPPVHAVERLTAADLMTTAVVTVGEDESVVFAGYLMREASVHHVPVLRGHSVVGVLDEAVLSTCVSTLTWAALHQPVRAVMHRGVVRVTPATRLRDVAAHLGRSAADLLVVTVEGRLVGVITPADVVAAVARHVGTGLPPDSGGAADTQPLADGVENDRGGDA